MGKVIFDISMSLDGFMTASHRTKAEPLGEGGQQLHDWAFAGDVRGRKLLEDSIKSAGAVIAGKTTYADSIPWWGPDGPTGPVRLPVFVVTHKAPRQSPKNGVYTFVTDGIEVALQKAKDAAAGKVVVVMGGASIGQQYIAAGLVDEISIHLVPVLFGKGIRMFENLGTEHIQLETLEVIETAAATHLRFRVVK